MAFQGKVALVTGAASGMGRLAAQRLARAGAVVAALPPIAPETVLDAIERDLERGRLMVFPDRNARFAVGMRRFLPGLLWKNLHRVEKI